jgi:AraC-like DNA-binding protein
MSVERLAGITKDELTTAEFGQVFFICRGSGFATLDGTTWKLGAGMIVVVPCGCLCLLRLSDTARVFRIAASPGFMQEKVMPAMFVPGRECWVRSQVPSVFNAWPGAQFRGLREDVFKELESARRKLGNHCDVAVVAYMFAILFAAIGSSRNIPDQAPQSAERTPQMNLIMSFRDLVERRFREQLHLSDYCKLAGTTPARLSRACTSLLDRTPFSIVHERLMVEAKRELNFSTRSVSEIAYRLGFEGAPYFCRFFKQHTGHSPLEFRKLSGKLDGANGVPAKARSRSSPSPAFPDS